LPLKIVIQIRKIALVSAGLAGSDSLAFISP